MHDFPKPRHLPCPDCGRSVARGEGDAHACDDETRLDYAVFQLREEIGGFDGNQAAWLDTPAGRFAAWLAKRDR
jgi:hypothetical protein